MGTNQFTKGFVWKNGKLYLGGQAVSLEKNQGAGNQVSYPKTTVGAQTLLPAAEVDRIVTITVEITTTFAAGDGAAPVFDIGETDTPEKFLANLNTGAAGTVTRYVGVLSANKALLVSGVAATGTTSAGVIKVTATAVPKTA